MRKNKDFLYFCISLLCLLYGGMLSVRGEEIMRYYIIADENIHDYNFVFDFNVLLKIAIKNLIVMLIISIMGYLTAGLLSIAILIWNGFLIGCLIKQVFDTNIYQYFIYHGIFEITSFCFAGIIGLNGFDAYRNLFMKSKLEISNKYRIMGYFIFSLIMLIIAAFIETYLISL